MKYLVEPQNIMAEKECIIVCECLGIRIDQCNGHGNCVGNCSSNCNGYCQGRCYRAVPYNKLEEE